MMDCERAEPAKSKGHSSDQALWKTMFVFLKSADNQKWDDTTEDMFYITRTKSGW